MGYTGDGGEKSAISAYRLSHKTLFVYMFRRTKAAAYAAVLRSSIQYIYPTREFRLFKTGIFLPSTDAA